MKNSHLRWTLLLAAGFVLTACGGGGGGGSIAPLTPADAAKAGTFAAIDNPALPRVGMVVTVAANAANTGFDVTGKAVNDQGATWTLLGTMTRTGVVQMNGTGLAPAPGAPAPANMTVNGNLTAAQTIVATANFDFPVAMTLEKAVPLTNPAVVGKFALATDPGTSNATQEQHAAASLTVQADGKLSAAFVQGGVTGIGTPLPEMANRFAQIDGILLNDGRIIGVGGGSLGTDGNPGTGMAVKSRTPVDSPSGVILMGTMGATAPMQAAVQILAPTLLGIVDLGVPFVLAPSVNPLAGIFSGTNTDIAAKDQPATNPCVIGVNENGTVAGFMRTTLAKPGKPFLESLTIGKVITGGALAPNATVPNPALPSGLVLMDDEGGVVAANVSGTVSGTIVTTTNPTSGIITSIASGAWQYYLGAAPETTGTFQATRLP